MPAEKYLLLAKKACSVMQHLKNRPKNREGKPGGLVMCPGGKKIIIVGDLHANTENLHLILDHADNERSIKSGKALLVILGDAVHNDQPYRIKEMESSLEILEFVFKLIAALSPHIVYLRGNHDTFDDQLAKSGIRQGHELKKYLLKERGEQYVSAVEEFFDSLPVFFIGKGIVITHAGPVRGGISRDELINIRHDSDEYHQLLWNRIHEFRGTPNEKEYGAEDIALMLGKLGLPPETHFIVGHNPLWNTGNKTGMWMDVLGIRNHHILYSGGETNAPYFVFDGGKLIAKFSKTPKAEAVYV